MRTSKTLKSTKIETSEGVIFFSVKAIYNDGDLWKTIYSKQDEREHKSKSVTGGETRYKNETSYNNAIKRAQK